jgi:hypothetical protein
VHPSPNGHDHYDSCFTGSRSASAGDDYRQPRSEQFEHAYQHLADALERKRTHPPQVEAKMNDFMAEASVKLHGGSLMLARCVLSSLGPR